MDPYNESPFRYLIGLLREQSPQTTKMLAAECFPKVSALETVLVNAHRDPEACTNWTSARIDLLEIIGDKASLSHAITLAEGLANQYDTIRKKYWQLRIRQLQQQSASTC